MRTLMFLALTILSLSLDAQIVVPGVFDYQQPYTGRSFSNFSDSSLQKKWFWTRHSAISASYSFFKGGSASVIAAPMGLQLNRKLSNNLYAFANATVAPAYVNFNRLFLNTDASKIGQNNRFQNGRFGMYSSASLGLMYVNDEKTFSVSGSLSVQSSSYPYPQYRSVTTQKQDRINGVYR